jgi:hypothetical protein
MKNIEKRRYEKFNVILKATMDKCGYLTVSSAKTQSDIFIQEDFCREDFIHNYIPKRYWKDLENGWDVKFKMDIDLWFTLNGYSLY